MQHGGCIHEFHDTGRLAVMTADWTTPGGTRTPRPGDGVYIVIRFRVPMRNLIAADSSGPFYGRTDSGPCGPRSRGRRHRCQVCGAIGAAGGISPRKAVARLGPIHGSLVPFTGPLVPFLRVRTREMASSKQSPFPSCRRASQIPRAATEPSKSASFVESVHTSSAE